MRLYLRYLTAPVMRHTLLTPLSCITMHPYDYLSYLHMVLLLLCLYACDTYASTLSIHMLLSLAHMYIS
jgi:hypothetical protein